MSSEVQRDSRPTLSRRVARVLAWGIALAVATVISRRIWPGFTLAEFPSGWQVAVAPTLVMFAYVFTGSRASTSDGVPTRPDDILWILAVSFVLTTGVGLLRV